MDIHTHISHGIGQQCGAFDMAGSQQMLHVKEHARPPETVFPGIIRM